MAAINRSGSSKTAIRRVPILPEGATDWERFPIHIEKWSVDPDYRQVKGERVKA